MENQNGQEPRVIFIVLQGGFIQQVGDASFWETEKAIQNLSGWLDQQKRRAVVKAPENEESGIEEASPEETA